MKAFSFKNPSNSKKTHTKPIDEYALGVALAINSNASLCPVLCTIQ